MWATLTAAITDPKRRRPGGGANATRSSYWAHGSRAIRRSSAPCWTRSNTACALRSRPRWSLRSTPPFLILPRWIPMSTPDVQFSLAVHNPNGRELTFAEAIREAIAEEMRRDPRVFVIGEDVAVAGTVFKVLLGMVDEIGRAHV